MKVRKKTTFPAKKVVNIARLIFFIEDTFFAVNTLYFATIFKN